MTPVPAALGIVCTDLGRSLAFYRALGLDGTLKTLAQQSYGQVLLTVTAVGLAAYGLYSFAEARFREL